MKAHDPLLYLLSQQDKPIGIQEIRKILSIPSSQLLSSAIFSACDDKLILKKKINGSLNSYSITKVGLKYLDKVDNSDWNLKAYGKYLLEGDNKTLNNKQTNFNTGPITGAANSAIDGISALVEENQRLRGFLTGMYSQLGRLLEVDKQPDNTEG